jgi:hypothetical protein
MKKEEITKIMAKALKTQEPVTFRDRPCFLTPLTYMDDLVLASLVQEVCTDALKAGLTDDTVNRAGFMANVLGVVKLSLHDAETGELVFNTMDEINAATKGNLEDYKRIQDLYHFYMGALELTREEKKSS